MPILDIEVVGVDEIKQSLTQSLADAAAVVLKTEPGHTWVKLRFLPKNQYAENGSTLPELKPVFVAVLRSRYFETKEKSEIALGLAKAFGRILHRPSENIHILFEPEGLGRIAFGGLLKTD